MGFARSAEQVAALLKVKKITLDSIFKEILEDQTLAYSNISKDQRYLPSGKRSPFMFVGQNPVFPKSDDVEAAKKRGFPLEMFEVSEDTGHNENGLLLNKCCEYLGLNRSDVYITNAVKYPTPNNDEPLPIDAKSHIKKFLFKEIFVVKPEIIFVMGNTVQNWFEKTFEVEIKEEPTRVTLNLKIDDDRIAYDTWIQKIYHPAYIKRNGNDFSLYEKQLDKSKEIVEEIILDWKYVHLHAHNSFSMKDGIGDPGTRIKWAVENRKNALATSNHGNIFDWLQIYNRCKAEKIKPILGCEFYFNRKGLELQQVLVNDEPDSIKKRKELKKLTNHFTAFAKNLKGYYNMIKINNDAWVNRFYRNPITAPEIIEANKEGIICLSGCSGSEANRVITSKFYLTSDKRKEDIDKLIENKLNSMKGVFRNASFEKYYDDEYLDDWDEQYFNDNQDQKIVEEDYKTKARKFVLDSDQEQIDQADIKAREIIKWWHGVFGDDFYVELMCIDYAPQILINQELIKIAKEQNISIVITNDVHYLERGGSKIQQLQMLNDQNKTWEDLRNDVNDEIWTIKSDEFFFKSVSEIKESWEKWHKNEIFTEEIFWEGIKNSIAISDKVENFTIDKSNKLPKMGANSKAILAKKVTEGLKEKGLYDKKEYKDRAMFEYSIICEKGFTDYFLIINDIIQYAKKTFGENSVGCGRGSAAGSLVNYVLGNTDVDPLKHDLLFERFLDIARTDPVDIDTDFEPRIRDSIVQYMIERFGREYVSNIGTFGISRTKVAIQDAGRVFSIPAQETLAVTKALGDDVDEDAPFEDTIEACPELKAYLKKWEAFGAEEDLKPETERISWKSDLKNLTYFIDGIRGNVRQISQHAAGVLVSSDKLMDNVALGRSRGNIVTGWQEGSDYHELSDLGYYKFDILGLNNLQVVNDAVSLIEKRHGVKINLAGLDLQEKEVYEKVVAAQDHMGVFQFESNLAHKIMKDIIPSNFEELSAISSLLRPGPLKMGMPAEFANRKWGRPDESGHVWTDAEIPKCIYDILAPTKGIIIFQEQFMLIGMKIGGLDKKEVNAWRKALVKYGKGAEAEAKRYAQVESYHQTFIKNAKLPENLGDEKAAEDLWDLIAAFAKYGFNKSISSDEMVEDKTRGILSLNVVNKLVKSGQRVCIKSADSDGNIIWVDVVNVYDHGVLDLVEVELEDGKKIKCTLDHKFRTIEGKMLPLNEILENDLEIVVEHIL